jgi:hypothetical protein
VADGEEAKELVDCCRLRAPCGGVRAQGGGVEGDALVDDVGFSVAVAVRAAIDGACLKDHFVLR